MYIAQINYPGTFLICDNDKVFSAKSSLNLIESETFSAAIALSMYEHARAEHSRLMSSEEFLRKRERRSKIYDSFKNRRSFSVMNAAEHDAETLEVDKIFLEQELSEGRIPLGYLSLIPMIHAKCFVLSIQMIVASISRLKKIPECAKAADDAHQKIILHFPQLLKVRNSIAHADERMAGMVKKKRKEEEVKIDTHPIESALIKSNGNTIVTSSLENDDFLWTLDDGSLGRFPINLDALQFVVLCVQELINSLNWRGLPKSAPCV